jgi:hypothetical protein
MNRIRQLFVADCRTPFVRCSVVLGPLLALTIAGSTTGCTAVAQPPPQTGFGFAVIGDTPYDAPGTTTESEVRFPAAVNQINADPAIQMVNHLGDIKSGPSRCDDTYFQKIRTQFDRFADPLVYTPGDNDWTDCHLASNGGYNPLERLQKIRDLFFPRPGKTLGQQSVAVHDQAGLPENMSYERAGVSFTVLHIVGSNNGLAPWTVPPGPGGQPQADEVRQRTAATLALINQTFDEAQAQGQRAVVLLTQADMFDPKVTDPAPPSYYSGFQDIVATIAQRSASFNGPVYLFNGDRHVFIDDRPLDAGSRWLTVYNVTPVSNLRRITVDGGSTGVNNYLRVIVTSDPEVLSWTKVPFTATP